MTCLLESQLFSFNRTDDSFRERLLVILSYFEESMHFSPFFQATFLDADVFVIVETRD